MLSACIALFFAALVYQIWYPSPFREMFGVGRIFLLILFVDVVCGPFLTLLLANPRKSRREITVDLGIIGVIQLLALSYGLHSVWFGRPVVLAFESDRLVVVSASEIDTLSLDKAPDALRRLPSSGVLLVATRAHTSNTELLTSIDLSMAGLTPAMRPDWWEPMDNHLEKIRIRAKPLSDLVSKRPSDAAQIIEATKETGYPVEHLTYLPLTNSKTKDWIALLNPAMKMVGYVKADGFD